MLISLSNSSPLLALLSVDFEKMAPFAGRKILAEEKLKSFLAVAAKMDMFEDSSTKFKISDLGASSLYEKSIGVA